MLSKQFSISFTFNETIYQKKLVVRLKKSLVNMWNAPIEKDSTRHRIKLDNYIVPTATDKVLSAAVTTVAGANAVLVGAQAFRGKNLVWGVIDTAQQLSFLNYVNIEKPASVE